MLYFLCFKQSVSVSVKMSLQTRDETAFKHFRFTLTETCFLLIKRLQSSVKWALIGGDKLKCVLQWTYTSSVTQLSFGVRANACGRNLDVEGSEVALKSRGLTTLTPR